MSIFSELRSLVFLRRIARAQERIAAVHEERLTHDRVQWQREVRRNPRPTEFGAFDVEAANKRWAEEQEAAEYGGTALEPSPSK